MQLVSDREVVRSSRRAPEARARSASRARGRRCRGAGVGPPDPRARGVVARRRAGSVGCLVGGDAGEEPGRCRASNPFRIRRKPQATPHLLGKSRGSAGQNGSENGWQNTKQLAVRLAVDSQTEDPEAGSRPSSGRRLPSHRSHSARTRAPSPGFACYRSTAGARAASLVPLVNATNGVVGA